MMKRRGVTLYFATLTICGVFLLTGMVLIGTESAGRQLNAGVLREKQADLCARSALQWAFWKATQPGLNWSNPSRQWDPPAFPTPQGECASLVELAGWAGSTPPVVPIDEAFGPVTLNVSAEVGGYKTGLSVGISPNVHPAIRYAVFGDRQVRLGRNTRLAAGTVLRTNGRFLRNTTDGLLPGDLFEGGTATPVLEVPVTLGGRLDNYLNYSNYRRFVNDFADHRKNHAPAASWNTTWTDIENELSPSVFSPSDHWFEYPDTTALEETRQDLETSGQAIPIHTTLSKPRIGADVSDCSGYIRYDNRTDPLHPVTLLTRLSLEGIYSLNANGGAVILREVRVKGTLFIHNLGKDVPTAWNVSGGTTNALTVDRNCVFEFGNSLAAPQKLPTLVVDNADSLDPDDRTTAWFDWSLTTLSPTVAGSTTVDHLPIGKVEYPVEMYVCTQEDCRLPSEGAPLPPFPWDHWDCKMEGVFITQKSEVTIDSTTASAIQLNGTVMADIVDLRKVRVSDLAAPWITPADQVPGLSEGGIQTIPYTWRNLMTSELSDVSSP